MANPQKIEHLTTWVNSWVECQALPGVMAGIYDESGKELYFHAADNVTDGSQKYTRDALFRIYSMTKPITAVAILLLVDRGVLKMDDLVSKWIPSFEHMQVCVGGTAEAPVTEPAREPIRITHLMTHTSGITYGFFGNNVCDQILRQKTDPDWKSWFHFTDLEVLCQKISETPLLFQPGSHYHYGLSIDVLGRIIEVAASQPLDKFLEENLFKPLSMNDTFFQVPESERHRLVNCYEVAAGQTYSLSTNPERERFEKPILLAGGGGLVSSITDYSKFTSFLAREGTTLDGQILLNSELVQEMRTNHLKDGAYLNDVSFEKGFSEAIGPGFGFGYAVSIAEDPRNVRGGRLSSKGEYGWGGVAATNFTIDPIRKRSAIFFTQLVGGAVAYPIRPQFRHLSHWVFDDEESVENV
jgi:CubicO group peptidase (beta-lactamase class C family)